MHGDCAQVEVSCCEGWYQWSEVSPAHQEMDIKDLPEALVELDLNESDKGRWNILLHCCLSS